MADHGLTAAQRKRLAREMRKLAMECVEGRAPKLTPQNYCGCAIGVSLKRAIPGRVLGNENTFMRLAQSIDVLLPETCWSFCGIVSHALMEGGPAALPFPLLALADAVESTPAIEAADV